MSWWVAQMFLGGGLVAMVLLDVLHVGEFWTLIALLVGSAVVGAWFDRKRIGTRS